MKQIVQTGHTNIRGVVKFKDSLYFANTRLSGFSLPQNDVRASLFECYRGGKKVSTFTSGDVVEKSDSLWAEQFSSTAGDITDAKMFSVEVSSGQTCKPVFMSLDLETPLGFASFLANASNHRKVFIPSTFNMSKILKSIHAQESVDLICDKDFFELEAPGPLAAEYKEMCASVKNVIVSGEGQAGASSIFSAKSTSMDPYKL